MNVRRPLTVLAAGVASLALAAGPASAHFCYHNDLTAQAAAGMAGSKAYVTFGALAAEFTGLCPAGIDVLADAGGVTTDTLINIHGVMAGGLEKQGKTNKAIAHLDFAAVEAAFGDAAAACGGTAA
jgi:hypothetical protein